MHRFLLRMSFLSFPLIIIIISLTNPRSSPDSGTDTHALTLFNVSGSTINTIRPYSPLLTTAKSSPVATAAFHPHQMQLAVGSMGHGNVEVFTCVDGVSGHGDAGRGGGGGGGAGDGVL